AGADVLAGVLGPDERLARLLLTRYDESRAARPALRALSA
ncbi:sirohydrochlorin chelatase, partial [Streptomyces sp. SID5475]|nr:sirohydrochlorin chelatase [Streptomyces sp. SID5475]